jgi:hypothetical protein
MEVVMKLQAMIMTAALTALAAGNSPAANAEVKGRGVGLEEIFSQCRDHKNSCAKLKDEYRILSEFDGIPVKGDKTAQLTSGKDGTLIKALKLVGQTAWGLIKNSQAQASARGKSAALVPQGTDPQSIQWKKRNTIPIPFKVYTQTCNTWRGICSTANAKILLVHHSDGKFLRLYAVAQRARAGVMWTLDADVKVENVTRPNGAAKEGTVAEMLVTVSFNTKLHPLGIKLDDDSKSVTYRLYGDGRYEKVGG